MRERRAVPERSRAEDLARIEVMTSFGVAYDFGVAAGRGDRPDYDLTAAALEKTWELAPTSRRPSVLTMLERVHGKAGPGGSTGGCSRATTAARRGWAERWKASELPIPPSPTKITS
jgi:hypothetical protein